MKKFGLSKSLGVILITVVIFSSICFGSEGNSNYQFGPPYKMYIVNRYARGGVILLTGNIDLDTKTLNLKYAPYPGKLEINVGEIIGDFENIKLLNTFNLEIPDITNKPVGNQIIKFNIPEFKKGMTSVIWINKLVSKYAKLDSIDNKEVLETAKNIQLEHERLILISLDKNMQSFDEVISEIERNQDE
jgi:hypothetical protein